MKYEKYSIKKGKLDLLSSLQALDKKLLNKILLKIILLYHKKTINLIQTLYK